jgi:hypothetical protein
LYYEVFESEETLQEELKRVEDKIQCVVADPERIEEAIFFGTAQFPGPWDYADRIDTLKFLVELR